MGFVWAKRVVTCCPVGIARHGGSVRDHRPGGRGRDRQADPGLEIGLVEAGKELARVGRDEQGVEVIAAVGRIVITDDARAAGRDVRHEFQLEACSPQLGAGGPAQRDGRSSGSHRRGPRPFTRAETRRRPRKSRIASAAPVRRKRIVTVPTALSLEVTSSAELVAHVVDRGGAMARECLGNTGDEKGPRSSRGARPGHRADREKQQRWERRGHEWKVRAPAVPAQPSLGASQAPTRKEPVLSAAPGRPILRPCDTS